MGRDRYVAITCIRNEDDIVEAFVRHTLAFVDRLLVIDHGSRDRTSSILAALVAEGLPLEVTRDDRVGNRQSEHMTGLMRRAATLGAAWVIPVDADEFLQVRGGGSLELPAAETPLVVGWTTYVPTRADDPDEPDPVARLRFRLRAEPHPFPKVFVPGVLAALPGAVLTQGSHGVIVDGRPVAPVPLDEVTLAHFPIRDVVQHAEKTATRWLQRAARGGAGAEDLFYEVQLENRLGDDWDAFADSVWGAVPSYLAEDGPAERIDDPIDYRGGVLHHPAPPRSLGPVLGRTLQLADRVIRSTRVGPDAAALDVPVHVRVWRGDDVLDAGTVAATVEQPVRVAGAVVDGPVDAVEIVVDAPGVLVDVRSVTAGPWSWTTGLGPHPVVTVLDAHGAVLPHLQCVRVLQPLAGARIHVAMPPGLRGSEVAVELIVLASPAAIAGTVVDRAHVAAMHAQLGNETPELVAMRADTFALQFVHDELVAARDRSERERDELYERWRSSQAHVAEIGAALDEMRTSRDGWHAEARARRGELDAIAATPLWRIRNRLVSTRGVRRWHKVRGPA